MRSNSLDFSSFETMNTPIQYKKTERTHAENQERAYIAASRRTDRSIEARVQSARMASEIHKRRTGKSFRITQEIVLREEMYEEEDDDLPRSYRVLGSAVPRPAVDINGRVQAYLANKTAMSKMVAHTNDEWRQNEVNLKFAEIFPQHAALGTSRTASSISPAATGAQPAQQQQQPPPLSPQQPPLQQQQHQSPPPQQQQAPYPQRPQPVPQQFQSMTSHSEPYPLPNQFYPQPQSSAQHGKALSTSALVQCPPQHPNYIRQDSGVGLTISPPNFNNSPHPDSPIDLGSSRSAFTSELPPEARMMLNVGMNASYEPAPQAWPTADGALGVSCVPRASNDEEDQVVSPGNDSFGMPDMKWENMMQQPMDDSTWNTFMDDSAWTDGQ